MKRISLTVLILLAMAGVLSAHGLWISAIPSFAHAPGHVMVSIGYGHTLPLDDTVNTVPARIGIEYFGVVTPDGEKIQLEKPGRDIVTASLKHRDFDVFKADLAAQKITFNKNSTKGNYLFEIISEPTYYTKYVDLKNQKRLKLQPKNEIRDIKKLILSKKYQAFGKAYLPFGKWTKPQPAGHTLEILPLSDLSNVKMGDVVEFMVFFHGKPLGSGPKGIKYLTAYSDTFGQGDGFRLLSYLRKGKGKFKVQAAGTWLVSVMHMESVTKDGGLKSEYAKTNSVAHGSTLMFIAK